MKTFKEFMNVNENYASINIKAFDEFNIVAGSNYLNILKIDNQIQISGKLDSNNNLIFNINDFAKALKKWL